MMQLFYHLILKKMYNICMLSMSLSVKSNSTPVSYCGYQYIIHVSSFLPINPVTSVLQLKFHCCLTQCAFIFNTLTVVECRHAKSKRDTRKPPCSSTSHHPIHGCVGESSVEVVGQSSVNFPTSQTDPGKFLL